MILHTVTVKVDKELKKKMRAVKINWSHYIRESIAHKIELEERKKAAEDLLKMLRAGRPAVPKGFINRTIREARKGR